MTQQVALHGRKEAILDQLDTLTWARRTTLALRRVFGASVPVLNSVDMSAWGGPLSAEEADLFIRRGIKLVIVGTGNPAPGGAGMWARQQAQMWVDRGGELLDAYIYLYLASGPADQVTTAKATLRDLPVRKWWLDWEDISPACQAMSIPQRLLAMADSLERAIDLAGSGAVGAYSGRWWWGPYTGNSLMFAHLALWDSYYPYGADENNVIIVPWSGREYGGFAEPEINQYRGTYVLDGQSVDLNFARLEDPDMAIKDQLERLLVSSWSAASEQSLPWAERVTNADYRMGKAILGVDDTVPAKPYLPLLARIDEHTANHPGGGSTSVTEHTHTPGGVIRSN